MIQIDMPMPVNCNDCPCAYFSEGMTNDYCQITQKDFDEETKENRTYKRQKWCPLIEGE